MWKRFLEELQLKHDIYGEILWDMKRCFREKQVRRHLHLREHIFGKGITPRVLFLPS